MPMIRNYPKIAIFYCVFMGTPQITWITWPLQMYIYCTVNSRSVQNGRETVVSNIITSPNGKFVGVTCHLWGNPPVTGESPPPPKASDADCWCFLWSSLEQTAEQTIETPLIWNAIAPVSPFRHQSKCTSTLSRSRHHVLEHPAIQNPKDVTG